MKSTKSAGKHIKLSASSSLLSCLIFCCNLSVMGNAECHCISCLSLTVSLNPSASRTRIVGQLERAGPFRRPGHPRWLPSLPGGVCWRWMLLFRKGCFGCVVGLAAVATWENCTLPLETVCRVDLANSTGGEVWAGPWGWVPPCQQGQNGFPPAQQWGRDISTSTAEAMGCRRTRQEQSWSHTRRQVPICHGAAPGLPPSPEGSFCAPPFPPLPPGPWSTWGEPSCGESWCHFPSVLQDT